MDNRVLLPLAMHRDVYASKLVINLRHDEYDAFMLKVEVT